MSMEGVGKKWQESVERLSQAQMQAGQSAFHALNEQDKLAQMIRALAASVEDVFSCMDMVNMEIAAALRSMARDTKDTEICDHLLMLSEQNAKAAVEFAKVLQDLMEEAEAGSKIIHRMEEDIAFVQEAFCELCAAAEALGRNDDGQ